MKSLSILIVLGTLSAIILGAVFAIRPAMAKDIAAQPAAEALAPVTGTLPEAPAAAAASADIPLTAPELAVEPGTVMAQAFVLDIAKDPESLVIEAAEQAAPALQPAVALEAAKQPAAAAAAAEEAAATSISRFDSFVSSVTNGNSGQVAGIFSEGVMAYSVVGQGGNAAFVSEQPGVVTKFSLASQYGSQGFLAHNYLAGGAFASLSTGDIITLVYGDGSTQQYQVTGRQSYQALSPDSTQSNFVDLASGEQLTASGLFHNVYNQTNALVLQTCIEQDGITTWGRLFITAVPLS